MDIHIRMAQNMGRYRYNWIKRNYGKVVFVMAGGHYVAITGTDIMPRTVTMHTQKKIPLWKQSMDMQMGRMPRTTKEDTERYTAMVITHPESMSYEIWEEIRR